MKRIKRIRSHTGYARFLAETSEEPTGYLARVQIEEIPSPYRYSPTVAIDEWNGKQVIHLETSHRCYDVFEVHPELLRFKTEDAAADWHVRYCKKA